MNKGTRLAALDRNDEAMAAYNEVIRRFGEATELSLREQAAKALINLGNTFGILTRGNEAINSFDEVVRRFGEAPELSLRELVAKALRYKGLALGTLNRRDEAIDVYDEVVRRFAGSTELLLREQVANALNSLGFQLLCYAKQMLANGEEEKAKKQLFTAQEKIIASLELRPNDAIAIGNYGYINFLLGEKELARALLSQAITIGGEKVRQGELDDANIHPLPQDGEFRMLVQSIPSSEAQEN